MAQPSTQIDLEITKYLLVQFFKTLILSVLLTVSSFLSVFFCAASFSTGSDNYINKYRVKKCDHYCNHGHSTPKLLHNSPELTALPSKLVNNNLQLAIRAQQTLQDNLKTAVMQDMRCKN